MVEIDTYPMLALWRCLWRGNWGLSWAGASASWFRLRLMENIGSAGEPALLERLMKLEAAIESRDSKSHYRFSAAAAYYELVRPHRRTSEQRIKGLQLFDEFMERRLAPAMATCFGRQGSMRCHRVSPASTQLLSTKVNIGLEQQNQGVLASMNRRAKLQLRLQQTVEGLSVAAITYYITGLVGYAVKAMKAAGVISIPIGDRGQHPGHRRHRGLRASPLPRLRFQGVARTKVSRMAAYSRAILKH